VGNHLNDQITAIAQRFEAGQITQTDAEWELLGRMRPLLPQWIQTLLPQADDISMETAVDAATTMLEHWVHGDHVRWDRLAAGASAVTMIQSVLRQPAVVGRMRGALGRAAELRRREARWTPLLTARPPGMVDQDEAVPPEDAWIAQASEQAHGQTDSERWHLVSHILGAQAGLRRPATRAPELHRALGGPLPADLGVWDECAAAVQSAVGSAEAWHRALAVPRPQLPVIGQRTMTRHLRERGCQAHESGRIVRAWVAAHSDLDGPEHGPRTPSIRPVDQQISSERVWLSMSDGIDPICAGAAIEVGYWQPLPR